MFCAEKPSTHHAAACPIDLSSLCSDCVAVAKAHAMFARPCAQNVSSRHFTAVAIALNSSAVDSLCTVQAQAMQRLALITPRTTSCPRALLMRTPMQRWRGSVSRTCSSAALPLVPATYTAK
eukprot:gnl/TRDRNA2_/TRDRNA2_164510_c0_seq1.p1 gnl/TRDRNA2_/TRDRNA2_164510_c0~~gnl/TRDRNA2_/TRDRNA2_164510_c0_seq1.p1  ORF type:complete len:122 (+),score=9.72 gnl/TRDRNA2_/TRDRNA2_164510_c0_seq1:117-482(+)